MLINGLSTASENTNKYVNQGISSKAPTVPMKMLGTNIKLKIGMAIKLVNTPDTETPPNQNNTTGIIQTVMKT